MAGSNGIAKKASQEAKIAKRTSRPRKLVSSPKQAPPPTIAAGVRGQLVEFRCALLAGRRSLLTRVVQHADELRWLDDNLEPEMEAEGQQQALARLLERLDAHERAEIAAIDRSLERMGRGEYGICTTCRGPIPLARQRALPTADTCVSCAQKHEARERT